jgi:transcriptional regulator with XRE-family HTH domain
MVRHPIRIVTYYSAFVGRALKERRLQRKLALGDVARRAGLRASEVAAIELGTGAPSVAHLQQLARVLGLSLAGLARDASPGRSPGPPPLGLDDIARAIVELPEGLGSKVDAAIGAAAQHALDVSAGNQSAAARVLCMDRKKFLRKLSKAARRRRSLAERAREVVGSTRRPTASGELQ